MTFAVLTFLLCIHGVLQKSSQNMTGIYTLTGRESSDPFPSLTIALITTPAAPLFMMTIFTQQLAIY